jgi:hypothetical protein
MHLFGYLYEDYHDARSLEHKKWNKVWSEKEKFMEMKQRIEKHIKKEKWTTKKWEK